MKKALSNLNDSDATRTLPFEERIKEQDKRFDLPLLPTTTIGSLPQTAIVKQTRTKWRKGNKKDNE